jgi:uncharacterized spore protein YtfJ
MGMEAVLARLVEGASVKSIYGEPVTAGGVTIVPVAQVVYGFGGGEGLGPLHGEEGKRGEGSGGGGGFTGKPVGYIEITATQARFVPIGDKKRLAAALALGIVVGMMLCSRREKE